MTSPKWTAFTPARIALGRQGAAVPTAARLQLLADHAAAKDAIYAPVNVQALRSALGQVTELSSQAENRQVYLQRPDLGRKLAGLPATLPPADVGLVVADGLSPAGINAHLVPLVEQLRIVLGSHYQLSDLFYVHNGRVAVADELAAACGWDVTIMIIGERPGLSSQAALGMYLTWKAVPGTTDERRNCISNINPPHGTTYQTAALVAENLIGQFYGAKQSGYQIKDRISAQLAPQVHPGLAQSHNQ